MSKTGSTSRAATPQPTAGVAVQDDQPTVISDRPPMHVGPMSESVYRILQGNVTSGDRLGHFDLVQYVGGGGMGRVFRGFDSRLARTVAIKILSPEQAADRDTVLRFQNEAQSAARLDHENIARVYYVGEDRGLPFIVFEFVEGINVRALVERQGPLPLTEALSYALQVTGALAHAATRNVVHRDIKPSNVLIMPDGHVKLIDMGLARVTHGDSSASDLTASGVTLGTFDYISPEQARDPRTADIRSDIYSLGCTLFFMLTGRPPFPEGTVLQKLLQHQGDLPPEIRQFRPELPEDVGRILRKMLAKDPRQRYPTPADLAADLAQLAEQIGLRPAGHAGGAWVIPRAPTVSFLQRHLPWALPIAALVLIVVSLDFVWSLSATRNSHVPPPTLGGAPDEPSPAPPGPIAMKTERPKATPGKTPAGPTGEVPPVPKPPAEPKLVEGAPAASVAGTLGRATAKPKMSATGTNLERRVAMARPDAPGIVLTATGGGSSEAAPKRTGLLVVKADADGDNEYSTLNAACSAARNGDVIELRYNDRRQERPISLANRKVTVRAGEGYQPIVVFRPVAADPLKHPRSMISLASGRLALIDLAIEFHVPREVAAEDWSLFETESGETVHLEKCTLTIFNAADQPASSYHQDVAFFRGKSPPGADAILGDGSPGPLTPAQVELVDCIVRGEAVFLSIKDQQPVHVDWNNGLLATTERLLVADGSPNATQPGEALQITLKHVTVVSRAGLFRLASSTMAPHAPTVEFHGGDSIIMLAPGMPLVDQACEGTVEECHQRVIWNGDRNFYEGSEVFWLIHPNDSEPPPEPMNFDAWQAYWGPASENLPNAGQVGWQKLPEADRPLHDQTPADYALRDTGEPNPPVGAASDGRNAGLEADRLPAPPAAEKVEKAEKPARPAKADSAALGLRSR